MIILSVPSRTDTLVLQTYAYGRGLGPMSNHVCGKKGKEILFAFFSRHLRGVEKYYSTTEWEALALVTALNLSYLDVHSRLLLTTNMSLMSSRVLNNTLQGLAWKLPIFLFCD